MKKWKTKNQIKHKVLGYGFGTLESLWDLVNHSSMTFDDSKGGRIPCCGGDVEKDIMTMSK